MKKMNRFQAMVMLDFLGVPMNEQPKKAPDTFALLDVFKEKQPEDYKTAYNIIVKHELPKEASTQEINAHVMGQAIADHISTYEDVAIRQVKIEAKKKLQEQTETHLREMEALRAEVSQAAHDAINEAAKQYITIKVGVGNKKPKAISGVVHEKFPRMIQLANARKNILLVGPSGSGKTHVAAQIAEALDLPFTGQSCAVGVSESNFSGWLFPIEAGGAFTYVPAPLIECYEKGGVFLFDELDNSDANVMVFVNQLLANDSIDLALRFKKTKVKRHKDFVAIGAANTWGTGATAMYNARQQLDAATLDRFKLGQVLVDYSPTIENALVDSEVLEWGLGIREIINSNNMRKVLSTRVMRDASDMKLQEGWGIEDIEEGYFADWSPEEMRVLNNARGAL